jgi:hypothetical protein
MPVFLSKLLGDDLIGFIDQQLFFDIYRFGALLNKERPFQRIGDAGNAAYNIFYRIRFLYRIMCRIGQQQIGLEEDKVPGLLGDIFPESFGADFLEVGIGVLSFRQHYDAYVEVLLQHHIQPTQGRFGPCIITVEQHFNIGRIALDEADLLLGQRSAGRGSHIFNAGLMERQHVSIAFHEDALVFAPDGPLGEVSAVQHFALVVDIRFRRIDILGSFGVLLQDPPSKADDFPRQVVNGEHDAVAEEVAVVSGGQPQLFQQIDIVSLADGPLGEGCLFIRGEAEAEFSNRFLPEAPFLEIIESHSPAPVRIEELLLEEIPRKLIDDV